MCTRVPPPFLLTPCDLPDKMNEEVMSISYAPGDHMLPRSNLNMVHLERSPDTAVIGIRDWSLITGGGGLQNGGGGACEV